MKTKLSEYLSKVKAGEEVVVTEHGRSIAKLVPMPAEETMDEHLADLERRGLIKRGTGKLPDGFWDWERPKVPEGWLQEWLDDERGDRA